MVDLEVRLARLERRLARERAARKSAEQIAEAQTLQLYELNQTLRGRQVQLQETLGYLRTILDHMTDSLVVVDVAGRIRLANRAFLAMFALDESILGQRGIAVLDPALMARLERAGAEADDFELPLSDDRVGAATVSSIVATNEAGASEQLGQMAMVRDVTTAKEIDRMKTDFISNVSHELRTPLTSVLGFTKIIRRTLDRRVFPALDLSEQKLATAVERIRSNLEIIVAEGDRLTALINDVLDVAKMEAGRVNWAMVPLDVGSLVKRVSAATAGLFAPGGAVRYRAEVEPNLPEVEGDLDRLIQVLVNLISNAAKFTDEGSVVCRARRVGEEVVLSVTDTGMGIAAEALETVFEKFKQVGDTLTDKPKGTGLGLPISRQIVLHHGGRIWVESTLGQGSTFSFSLPIPAPAEEGPATPWNRESLDLRALLRRLEGPTAEGFIGAGAGIGRTVLVVDDEPSIREYLKQELQVGSYTVIEARDGLEGIAVAKERAPDLIILDVMMPKMNGFDAAAVLKNDPRTAHIPIMIHSIVEDRERGFRLGIDRYLAKPAETATLLNEVASLTTQAGKRILVVGAPAAAAELGETLATSVAREVEVVAASEALARAKEAPPDMIVIDASCAGYQVLVQQLRAEKTLEKVPLFLLADEGDGARPVGAPSPLEEPQ